MASIKIPAASACVFTLKTAFSILSLFSICSAVSVDVGGASVAVSSTGGNVGWVSAFTIWLPLSEPDGLSATELPVHADKDITKVIQIIALIDFFITSPFNFFYRLDEFIHKKVSVKTAHLLAGFLLVQIDLDVDLQPVSPHIF